MNGFRLRLMQKDLNGDPKIDGSGKPATVIAAIEFFKTLPGNKSLFHFKFEPSVGQSSLDFFMNSDSTVEFFRYFANVISSGQIPVTLPPETADANGKANGTFNPTIEIVNTFTVDPGPNMINVQVCGFSLTLSSGESASFMLTNTDTQALYQFMDAMLWSNPPNPPH